MCVVARARRPKSQRSVSSPGVRETKRKETAGHQLAVSSISSRPSPALLGGFTPNCCGCCSSTRTGRRRASLRFLTMGTRNHTHLGLLTAALLSLTLSRARQVSWWRGLRRSGPTSTSTRWHPHSQRRKFQQVCFGWLPPVAWSRASVRCQRWSGRRWWRTGYRYSSPQH